MRSSLMTLTRYLVDNMAARTYPGDFEYFNGQWVNGVNTCWMCNSESGAAAAVLAGLGGRFSNRYKSLAQRTFTDAIARYQRPDGSFSNPSLPSEGETIPTIFFGVALGQAYLALDRSLPRATGRMWRGALSRAAAYLIDRAGALSFYINGNVNLQSTELFYFAWRATGSTRLRSAYNASWAFLLHPGGRFRAFGLRVTHPYERADGSDGRGYLKESGGGEPGFDADYTQLQSDEAARLFLYSRDPRALLLLNLLSNQLLTRRSRGWLLNTSGGTRHPQPNRFIPFTSSGLAVLAWLGARRDLRVLLPAQLYELRLTLCGGLTYGSPNIYREAGNELSVIVRAAQQARIPSARRLWSGPPCPNIPLSMRERLTS